MPFVVFTGGARSGKSSAAQSLAGELFTRGRRVTVAVFADGSADIEMAERIERHRSARPAGFAVLEASGGHDWMNDVPVCDVLLVDCLGSWLSLAMAETWASRMGTPPGEAVTETPTGYRTAVEEAGDEIVRALLGRPGDTIVVTNEVGDGVVPEHASARLFRDTLGRMNRAVTAEADAAYLCVAGRLLELGTLAERAQWPED